MTSKIKIDIAKIKEERKQYASKLELYKNAKTKQKKVSSVIKFDELKKFHALEKLVSEPSIPVEEYGDPTGNYILEADEYQSVFNAMCAYKSAVHQKGQANIKISNILKYNDYSKEEKNELGLKILYLMSVHPEYTEDCVHILDQWLFEWQPSFLEVCILLENYGCNVRKHLGNHYIPNCYEVGLVKAKVDYEEFNTKTCDKYLELNVDCLKNVLVYLKSITGYYNEEEVQSLLVVLSALSLDTQCIQFKDLFNELVNKCFACLENTNTEHLLNTLYLMFQKSMDQCYFVNKILNPCNSVCEPFAMQLSYVFMCNLLFNYNLVELDTSIRNVSSDSGQKISNKQRNTRSKRKLDESKKQILESHSSPKKQQVDKEKLLLEKENTKLNNVKAAAKPLSKGRGKGKRKINSEVDKTQKSILDYWKVREKSPDLTNSLNTAPFSKNDEVDTKLKESNKILNGILGEGSNEGPVFSPKKEVKKKREDVNVPSTQATACIDLTEDSQSESDEAFPTDAPCEQLRGLIFAKYKDDTVSFLKLYKLIRKNLQHYLDCPVRIYRIVNLLNCIVKLLRIDESNMDTCKLLMQELSQVQFKYYGLHDMHRHLVCVYLQQYTTVWGTFINRIQYQIEQRQDDYQYSDSD